MKSKPTKSRFRPLSTSKKGNGWVAKYVLGRECACIYGRKNKQGHHG